MDLYLAGHDHDLEVLEAPGEPLHVVSGGGGRGLYGLWVRPGDGRRLRFAAPAHGFARVAATPGRLVIEMYDERGSLLHARSLERGPLRGAATRPPGRGDTGGGGAGATPLPPWPLPVLPADVALFRLVNPDHPPSRVGRWLLAMGAEGILYATVLLLVLAWIRGGGQTRRRVLYAAAGGAVTLGGGILAGALLFHPRPFMLGIGVQLLSHGPESSFPSDHASVLFGALAGWLVSGAGGRVGLALLGAGLVTAWARVRAGVHFPLDMAGSALLAVLAGFGLRGARRVIDGRWVPRALGCYRSLHARLHLPSRLFPP